MRKLAPARVSYQDDFLISYRVYRITGSYAITLCRHHKVSKGGLTWARSIQPKIPTGPTGKIGPPQKVDPFFRNFFGWTEPIH